MIRTLKSIKTLFVDKKKTISCWKTVGRKFCLLASVALILVPSLGMLMAIEKFLDIEIMIS